MNLQDSGFNVVVGLRPDGNSWAKAEADGLTVKAPNDAVKGAAIIAFLTPDMVQKSLYQGVVDDMADGVIEDMDFWGVVIVEVDDGTDVNAAPMINPPGC